MDGERKMEEGKGNGFCKRAKGMGSDRQDDLHDLKRGRGALIRGTCVYQVFCIGLNTLEDVLKLRNHTCFRDAHS